MKRAMVHCFNRQTCSVPKCPSVRGWRPEFYLLPLRGEGEIRVCPALGDDIGITAPPCLSFLPCSHEILFSLGFSVCLQVCDFLVKTTEEPYTDNKVQEVLLKSQEKVQVRSAAREGTERLEGGLKKPCHRLAFTSEGLEKEKLSAVGDDASVHLCFA